MPCLSYQCNNPAETTFYLACGVLLPPRCPQCEAESPLSATFCGACGTSLMRLMPCSSPIQLAPRPATYETQTCQDALPYSARGLPDAERRQLTVLFCDLVNATPRSGQLDPEDYREVVRAYHAVCAEVIQRFDGSIAQYLGDGVLVYFGYPHAHEDDAQRAVRAGLELVAAIGMLQPRLVPAWGERLAVRVGIHTGLVVVGTLGSGGRQEPLALGETPNLAARLQGLAAPDTVVISAATARLVEGYFACQDLGQHALKGVVAPIHVWQVLGVSGAQSRLEIASPRGLTPLVGRDAEVALLRERWAQVKDGLGQVVLLSGEAGIGKSRLVQVVQEQVAGEACTRIAGRGLPYYQHSAFSPVIAYLQRALAWERDDAPAEKLRKLETALEEHAMPRQEVVPLFAALLALPLPTHYAPLMLTPQRQRYQTLEALLTWLLAEATRQPVLLIVEDLHWVDPSTLELLSRVVEQGSTSRIYSLFTFRPDFTSPWTGGAHLTPISLGRLSRPQVERMVQCLGGGKALPAEVVQHIVARADGVPLFAEELTKAVLESGLLQEAADHYTLTGALPALAVPATLQDALMARLDQVRTAKAVAQLGATIGRQFSYELLQAVSPLDAATLQQELARLVDAEVLSQRGLPPRATYLFKHALIQEAAYQSVLKRTRQHYHRHIAQVLAERFPETVATQPELLAYHYTAAGLVAQAIPYWQQAGQHALERSATTEAIGHLSTGLALLTTLPDTPERCRQELDVQTTLGPALMATRGYAAPEVEHAYTRVRELCQQVGETPELFPVLFGLWRFYVVRAELQTAYDLARQLLTIAQRQHAPALLIGAHWVLGATVFFRGALAQARTHLEQGVALYAAQQHRALTCLYAVNPGVVFHSYASWVLWLQGYPDQAARQSHAALSLAQGLAHPYSLTWTLGFATLLQHFRREVQTVHEQAEATITLATEQGFPLFAALGTVLRGWSLTVQGQAVAGMPQIQQGVTALRTLGVQVFLPCCLAIMAEAYGHAGQPEAGLPVLAEALEVARRGNLCWWEAELYRLRGELLLRGSAARHAEAECCFQHALTVAHRQQARTLELRAATSLSQLWQRQGKVDAARQLLAPISGWFTEGFASTDLKQATALLDELA